MSSTTYLGTELDAFAHASNWKQYLRHVIKPYLQRPCPRSRRRNRRRRRPHSEAARRRPGRRSNQTPHLPADCRSAHPSLRDPVRIIIGTLDAIRPEPLFDCVIYIDVLEHIEKDAEELRRAAARLITGGTIVVLSPAHQSLYTAFDEAIGHYRRYDRRSLSALTPAGTTLVDLRYLDSTGLWLSLGNRVLLRSSSPTVAQVTLWDSWCIPISRRLDPFSATVWGNPSWRCGAAEAA